MKLKTNAAFESNFQLRKFIFEFNELNFELKWKIEVVFNVIPFFILFL